MKNAHEHQPAWGTRFALGAPAMNAPIASLASLTLLISLAACSDLAAPVDPMGQPPSGGQGSSHAGASGTDDPHGGTNAHGGKGSGNSRAGSSARAGNAGSEGTIDDITLSLTSAEAHIIGRDGDAVRFTIEGTRSPSGVYSIAVSFEDAQGMP